MGEPGSSPPPRGRRRPAIARRSLGPFMMGSSLLLETGRPLGGTGSPAGFCVRPREEEYASASLRGRQKNIPADRPRDVIHLKVAEEMLLAVVARARGIGGKPAEARREELGPAVIATEVARLLPGAGAARTPD